VVLRRSHILDNPSAFVGIFRIWQMLLPILNCSCSITIERAFVIKQKGRVNNVSTIDQLIKEINDILGNLSENKLLYILTFIKKVFGSC